MAMWQQDIETLPREELKKLQSERLKWQVARMYENVELFRKRMDEKGLNPEDIKLDFMALFCNSFEILLNYFSGGSKNIIYT